MRSILLIACLHVLAATGQSRQEPPDSLCSLIAGFHKTVSLDCIYDTIVVVGTHVKSTAAIFAIRSVEKDGTNTPFEEIFVTENGKLTLVRTDTLITEDCSPCKEPRDFKGISTRIKDGKKQVLISCSYFYLRHGLAGTVHRKFVYEFTGNPVNVRRDPDSEETFKHADVGEIDGE